MRVRGGGGKPLGVKDSEQAPTATRHHNKATHHILGSTRPPPARVIRIYRRGSATRRSPGARPGSPKLCAVLIVLPPRLNSHPATAAGEATVLRPERGGLASHPRVVVARGSPSPRSRCCCCNESRYTAGDSHQPPGLSAPRGVLERSAEHRATWNLHSSACLSLQALCT